MKHLYLMRHGKSDWSEGGSGPDIERPLAPRGVRSARTVGRFLRALDEVPDTILASPAERTTRTIEHAIEGGAWDRTPTFRDGLYLASRAAMIEAIRSCDDAHESMMLVGHEPSCSDLVSALVGGAHVRFPTAALARIDLRVLSWRDADVGRGTLEWYVIPRMLEAFERASGEDR